MPDALCLPHKNRDAEVVAVRLIGGVPMCGDCVAGKPIETVASRFDTPSIHARDGEAAESARPEPNYSNMRKSWRDCSGGCGRKVNPNNKIGSCADCRKKGILAVSLTPVEEKTMPKAMPEPDRIRLQNARSDGLNVAEVAKKFDVSMATVYRVTKAPKQPKALEGAEGVRASIEAESRRNQKPAAKESRAVRQYCDQTSDGKYDGVLADLRAKRDAIDAAIATIEALA